MRNQRCGPIRASVLLAVLALAACAGMPNQVSTANRTPVPSNMGNRMVEQYANGVAAFDRGDFATAYKILRPLAAAGIAPAPVKIGRIYANGYVVERNCDNAFRWYRRAAGQGQPNSMHNLAWIYALGHGVAVDRARAYAWLTLAIMYYPDDDPKLGLARRQLNDMAVPLHSDDMCHASKLIGAWNAALKARAHGP